MISAPQNKLFHVWMREIAKHLQSGGAMVTAETVKELCLMHLGNVKMIEGIPGMPSQIIAMRSHKFKQVDDELHPAELAKSFVSMAGLLTRVEVWAATDLNLNLVREDGEANSSEG